MRQPTIELSRPRDGTRNCGSDGTRPSTGPHCPAGPCRAGDEGTVRRVRGFLATGGGAVSIETAIAISVLVIVLASLIGVFDTWWTHDRYRTAAYAAAHKVALNPNSWSDAPATRSLACEAIKAELGFDGPSDCEGSMRFDVHVGLTPADLLAETMPEFEDRTGDMVLVEIRWDRWLAGLGSELILWSALGVARGEPAGS